MELTVTHDNEFLSFFKKKKRNKHNVLYLAFREKKERYKIILLLEQHARDCL